MADVPEVMTTAQAAAYLQVDKKTLYNLVKAKRIKCAKIGDTFRFHKAYLDTLMGVPLPKKAISE